MGSGLFIFVVLLALVPTLFYILLIWWLDRYEKEPLRLLLLTFVWGAVPTVILSIIFELLADYPLSNLDPYGGAVLAPFLSVAVIGPFIEETFKAAIVFTLFMVFRREFDDVLDGIVYGAMVGLGFAFVENVLYGTSFAAEGGAGGALFGALLRSVIFGLNHSLFTGMAGAGLGAARRARGAARYLWPAVGFLLAWVLHMSHNTLVSLGLFDAGLIGIGLLLGIFVDWFFILVLVIVAGLAVAKERRWISQQLLEEVQVGRLTPAEYTMLTSSIRRIGARWRALTSGGLKAYNYINKLQALATELAFRKQQVLVEQDPAWSHYDVQLLRARIDALKGTTGMAPTYY